MYEFIENLEKEEYENFVINSEKSHFMQSYSFGQIQKIKGFKPYYVGIKKNNQLIATALLLEKKIFKNIGYMYSPRGFILDYNNYEVLEEFTKHLKKLIKRKNNIFLRIDPDLDIKNNIDIINKLKQLNFKHKGFNKNFENNQPRYTFRLNIDKDIKDVYKNFHPTTRKILNKGNQYNLKIYKGNVNDINEFYTTMKETALRENIIPSKREYYQKFYEEFNQNNMSDIYMVKVNIDDLKQKYIENINNIKKEIENINNKEKRNIEKSSNLINDLNNKLNKCYRELEEIKNIKEKELTLSSIITVKYNDKVWTVHGGNHSLLRWLNANYLLYYEIIKDANKDKYKIIDFFGTTGDPKPDNPIYGIHLFKERLGGTLTEFIGEFDYINKPVLYFLYKKYLKIRYKK